MLDTVDEIIYKFEVDMQDVSLTNLNAPWLKLQRLSNETEFLGSQFDDFFEAIDSVDNFNDVASEEVSFIKKNCFKIFILLFHILVARSS